MKTHTQTILKIYSIILPIALFLSAVYYLPGLEEKLSFQPSKLVLDQNGELLRVTLSPDEMWRMPITAEEISPLLKKAVMAYEDRHFYYHFGVNPVAMVRALVANIRAGGIVQGGSTITMQVARMMDPAPRTVPNKLIEMLRALQLELRYSKQDILTLYFNMAPYGGNIVGSAAASYIYFDKNPRHLSLGEAALLAAIPNNPNLLRPDVNPDACTQVRDKILNILEKQGKITAVQKSEAQTEPIHSRRYDMPFQAPHLSTMLLEKYPQKTLLNTTIDPKFQKLAERILENHLQPWKRKSITNGAVVIIDNRNRNVLALVGSANFFDDKNNGQVNGATAPRSPGSALKPFIYALGIENGLITPQTRLYDVPVEYSGYRPVNYDDTYHGWVTVEDALTRSLNVPAVNLYAQLGEQGLYFFLKEAGISTLPKPKDYYGLSLILGGCGVTLLELTNLYAGLANGGEFEPCKLLREEDIHAGKTLLSEGACYILSEMLSQVRRPELPAAWEHAVNLPKVAWKTGTSYGHRDAWSIGYTPNYTIGVWVGNFDATGVPELVGAEVAAPLLFALFNTIENPSENKWFIQPAALQKRQVCTVSGMLPTDYCSSVKEELYLPGISPVKRCDVHQKIFIDKKTSTRLCSHCRIGRTYDEKIIEHWPAEIATWMSRHGFPVEMIPEHFPQCPKILAGKKPIILSPSSNTIYKIREGVAKTYQKILLQATVSNDVKTIYWFLDGKLISANPPAEKKFIEPNPGQHRITCTDDAGRSSEIMFIVK